MLLLATADDAAGLVILAVFYPQGDLSPEWLLLSVGAAVAVWYFFNYLPRQMDLGNAARPASTKVRARFGFWPYVIAAALSWYGFQQAGIHPALGLLPVIPALPHADTPFGLFGVKETHKHDMLNDAEHGLKAPVDDFNAVWLCQCRGGVLINW